MYRLSLCFNVFIYIYIYIYRWKVRTRKSRLFPRVEEGFAPSAYLKAKNETVDLDIVDTQSEPQKDEKTTLRDLKKKKEYVLVLLIYITLHTFILMNININILYLLLLLFVCLFCCLSTSLA